MLRADVREAVEKNKFAIYSVKNIDRIMELLTDKQAGKFDQNNKYPQGTINYLLQMRIDKLNKLRKHFSDTGKQSRRKTVRNKSKSKP